MKVSALTILFLGTVLFATSASAGGFITQCCACRPVGPPFLPALFCAEAPTEADSLEFENQCSDLSGTTTCVKIVPGAQSEGGADGDNVDCTAVLRNVAGVTCPGPNAAPAPVLGTGLLAGLALALAGLGAWTMRRRSRALAR
jgi:hypothetical protein